MTFRVKICGITRPDQGRAIAELGATALGFICVPASPRYVEPDQIRLIGDAVPNDLSIDRIGVFTNADVAAIAQIAAIGCLTGVQLHGNESPQFCQTLRAALPDREIIKALRIKSADSLSEAAAYEGIVDTLLLDAYHPHLLGGTGKTLDWQDLQQFRPPCPWLLAGGLTPDNVLDAIAQVKPDGIDLSSGVERSPGDKDVQKVKQLFAQLQQAVLAG